MREMMALEWGRCRSRQPSADDSPVRMERSCDYAQKWTLTSRAAHTTSGGSAQRASTPAQHTRALSGRRQIFHTADRANTNEARVPSGARSTRRCARPSSHVLFTLGDARRTGSRDPGACGTQGSFDDAALHASESCSARQRHSAARSAAVFTVSWRYFGDADESGREV